MLATGSPQCFHSKWSHLSKNLTAFLIPIWRYLKNNWFTKLILHITHSSVRNVPLVTSLTCFNTNSCFTPQTYVSRQLGEGLEAILFQKCLEWFFWSGNVEKFYTRRSTFRLRRLRPEEKQWRKLQWNLSCRISTLKSQLFCSHRCLCRNV